MPYSRARPLAALALAACLATTGCIGEFAMTKDVYDRNQRVANKVAREALFVGLLIVPIYELALLGDLLVVNTIELFTDQNPWREMNEERADSEP